METFASSAFVFATLMNSRRRSSVSCGIEMRITVPSLEGLTPRSESRIARSMIPSVCLSYGVTRAIRGSGTVMDASWLIGVIVS